MGKEFITCANKLSKAVNAGFVFDTEDTFINILMDAEEYIINNCRYDGYEHIELLTSGYGQSYNDPNGYNHSGEGWINFQNTTEKIYYHFKDEKSFEETPVALYEIPDEKRCEYAFIFADFIDNEGNHIALYDFLG